MRIFEYGSKRDNISATEVSTTESCVPLAHLMQYLRFKNRPCCVNRIPFDKLDLLIYWWSVWTLSWWRVWRVINANAIDGKIDIDQLDASADFDGGGNVDA